MGRSRQACSDNRGSLVPNRRASQGSSAVGSRSAASVATPNICVVSQQAVETRHPGRSTRAARSRYRKGEERATDSQRRQFGHSPEASPGRQMRCAATTFTWGRLGCPVSRHIYRMSRDMLIARVTGLGRPCRRIPSRAASVVVGQIGRGAATPDAGGGTVEKKCARRDSNP